MTNALMLVLILLVNVVLAFLAGQQRGKWLATRDLKKMLDDTGYVLIRRDVAACGLDALREEIGA